MNDVKETLQRHADGLTAPRVDIDQIVRTGNRRVRRGRVTAGVAVVAVAGVVAGTALVLPSLMTSPATREQNLAASPGPGFEDRRVSYASGDVIHWGTDSFSVGRTVVSYVQTDDGFVFAGQDGGVFLYDGTSAELVGHSENNRLRADDTGSLVTWVDRAEDGAPQYVVYDTSERGEVARVDDSSAGASRDPGDRGAEVFAVDDGWAYWRHGPDLVSHEIATGEETVLDVWQPPADPADKDAPVAVSIADVANGQLAYYVDGGAESGLRVGTDIDTSPEGRTLARASHGVLSPDASYLGAEENDDIAMYHVASGKDVVPQLDAYAYAVPFGWIDDDTATVFALEQLEPTGGRYAGALLECDIPTGACAVATELEVDPASFTLPDGDPTNT